MTIAKNTDWPALIEQAKTVSENAHAPYSNFHVGAAAVTKTGMVVRGCNVENASYGLTLCAERNCIAQAVAQGDKQLQALVVYTKQQQLTPPCGACRQVLVEFFAADAQIMSVNHLNEQKIWTVAQLLPDAFTPDNIAHKHSS